MTRELNGELLRKREKEEGERERENELFFPKRNEEGDDPSRVGGPIDGFLSGIPLTTGIGFQDGRSGTAAQLNRAANRVQNVRE